MLTNWLGRWLGGWFGSGSPAPAGAMSGAATLQVGATGGASARARLSGTSSITLTTSGVASVAGATVSGALTGVARVQFGGYAMPSSQGSGGNPCWGVSWGDCWGVSWGHVGQPSQAVTKAEVLYVTATTPHVWFQYSQLAILVGQKTLCRYARNESLRNYAGARARLVYVQAKKRRFADEGGKYAPSVSRGEKRDLFSGVSAQALVSRTQIGRLYAKTSEGTSALVEVTGRTQYVKKGIKQ